MRSSDATHLSRTLKAISLCSALIVYLLSTAGFARETAQPQTTFRVVPASKWVRIGRTTVMELMVEQVSGLYGAEIHLSFDPEVLEVIDVDASKPGVQIEPGSLPYPDFVALNQADNQDGTIGYAATQLPPSTPASGQGVIARVTFRAKKAAASQIQVNQVLLVGPEGKDIAVQSQPTQIEIRDYSILLASTAGAVIALLVLGAIGLAYRKRK